MLKKLISLGIILSSTIVMSCSTETLSINSIENIPAPTNEEVEAASFFNNVDLNYQKYHPKFYNQKYPVAVIAHRGYRDVAPENTLAAFKKAIQLGADMFELDVSLSKDGHLIVIHDNDLNRTTNGNGLIEDKTLAEIKALDAGSWFSPIFKGEKVPTLDEALELAKGKIAVNIEIKPYTVEQRGQIGLEKKVVESIKKYGMEEHVIVSSFSETAIKRIKIFDNKIPTALLFLSDGILRSQLSKASKVQSDAVNEEWRFIRKSEVEKAHNNGIKVNAWTVNNPKEMLDLINKNIDGLITDRPDLALKVLADKFPNAGR